VAEIVIDPFRSPYASELPAPQPALAEPATAQVAAAPGFSERMGRIEMQLLQEALAQHGQNQRRAAAALGLSYDQMRHLVRKHQLPRRRRRAQ